MFPYCCLLITCFFIHSMFSFQGASASKQTPLIPFPSPPFSRRRKLHTASLLLLSKLQTLRWFEVWCLGLLPNWWAKVDSHSIAIMLRFASRNRSAKEAFPLCPLVGQSGLEPPTSRLSVVCSSQLSYWPMFSEFSRRVSFPTKLLLVEISGIEPLTSCLQGRRSPS